MQEERASRLYPGIQLIGYGLYLSRRNRRDRTMKKEDVLLRLIAISGEMPAELVREVVGSESYAAVLVTKLKKEGFISVRN